MVYIDNNTIPELIVYYKMVEKATTKQDYGEVFTWYNGKINKVNAFGSSNAGGKFILR